MDYNTENDIELFVADNMRRSVPFTSLDIANKAKEAGHVVRNREVAEWLRSNAIRIAHSFGYMYNQTLIRVDSKSAGMTYAYLYHQFQDDPDNYQNRDQNPKNPGYKQPTPQPSFQSGGMQRGTLNTFSSSSGTGRSVVGRQQTSSRSNTGHDGWMDQYRDSRGRFGPKKN